MSSEFNLPGSSFEEVQKIIKGYGHSSDNASLDTLAKLTGLHKTVISRNNKFLNDVGLITGGMKKSPTELGRRLGRALDHKQDSDVVQYWAEAIKTNETVSGLVTTVRIKGGMSEKSFSDHVLYVSGQKNNAGNKTGARCIVDLLVTAKLIEEKDGKLSVAAPVETSVIKTTNEPFNENQQAVSARNVNQESDIESIIPSIPRNVPQIAINIQLHLPETDNAEVYEKLFKALREQLISPKE